MHGAIGEAPQARRSRRRRMVPCWQQTGASSTEGGECRVRKSSETVSGGWSAENQREAARERPPRCSAQRALSCWRPRAWCSCVRLIGLLAMLVHVPEAPVHFLHGGGRVELPRLRDAVEPRIPHALWGLWGEAQKRCGGDPRIRTTCRSNQRRVQMLRELGKKSACRIRTSCHHSRSWWLICQDHV